MSSIKIVAEIEINPEHRESVLPFFEELVKGSRSEQGNKYYDLTENIEQSGHFFVLEEWASEEAIKEHNNTIHFNAFVNAINGKAKKLTITKVSSIF